MNGHRRLYSNSPPAFCLSLAATHPVTTQKYRFLVRSSPYSNKLFNAHALLFLLLLPLLREPGRQENGGNNRHRNLHSFNPIGLLHPLHPPRRPWAPFCQLDQVINPQNRNRRLRGKPQTLNLTDRRLHDPRRKIIPHHTLK